MRVLILGAAGMLGHTVYDVLGRSSNLQVFGTVRQADRAARPGVLEHVDALSSDDLHRAFAQVEPDVVINCVGVIKQLNAAKDPLRAIPINAILPHRLAVLGQASGARLIHISTDCVFAGDKGGYTEADRADPVDLYGRSKLLGEVDYPNAVTLRTSIIGHELRTRNGLLEWFLGVKGPVTGFRRAIFSGLPTVVLAQVIAEHVLPRPELTGVYHVSVDPVNKYDLLKIFAEVYGRDTPIIADDAFQIDRSLNSDRFRQATGFSPPSWRDLVRQMRAHHEGAALEAAA